MGLFGKNRDKDDETEELDEAREEREARRKERRENRKKKKGKSGKGDDGEGNSKSNKKSEKVGANNRRKDESVIREMVFETAVSTMKGNKLFRVTRDDEELFVGILLKFESIGGLSKKDMRDESKGQIITLINNGGIASIFTGDLKSKDQIVFIPNKETLAQMSEFSLLADDLEYELVLVNAYDESVENTGEFVDLEYLLKCHKTNMSISDRLGKILEPTLLPGDEGYSAASAAAAAAAEPEPAAPVETFGFDDGEPEDSGESEYGGDTPPGEFDSGSPEENYGFDEFSTGGDGEDEYEEGAVPDGEDEEPEESYEESPPVHIGAESSAKALSRKFFNDDMARELDTSALDQAIAGIGQFTPISQRPNDTWLNQQLNAMIDLANQELLALHRKNVDIVRNSYLNAIGNAYISEMSKVEDYKDDPRYEDIASQTEQASQGLDEIIAEERAKLTAEWEEKVHNAGEVARVNAEQTYKERYQYQYEERLRNVDAEVRAGLQAAENVAIADLKAARQREAQIRLDEMDSEEIAKAVENYQQLLSAEADLFARHEAILLKFLEDNRQAEIARIKVLASELERDDKIAQIQNEYKAKAEALQTDFEARITGLQSDIDTMRIRHNRELADKDAAYAELESKYNAEKREWKDQLKDMADQLVEADKAKERAVAIRVDEMKAERDSYSQKYEHLMKTQKSSTMMLIALAIVGSIAALAIGTLLGAKMFGSGDSNSKTPDTPPAIVETQTPGDNTGDTTPDDGGDAASPDTPADETPAAPEQTPTSDPEWDALQDPVI